MVKVTIDLDEKLDKKVKFFMIDKGFTSKAKAILQIVRTSKKNG